MSAGNRSDRTDRSDGKKGGFIPPHGGQRELLSYRKAQILYDLTCCFCARFLKRGDRTIDQMVQAARYGSLRQLASAPEIGGWLGASGHRELCVRLAEARGEEG